MRNIAFIDGQNLHLGTTKSQDSWKINLKRFRTYLEQKYRGDRAYYYIGFAQDTNQDLYRKIRSAGFILVFRQHNSAMLGKKKGNVDSDIILDIMTMVCRKKDFEGIILVSGDGDYKGLVDFLIEEDRLEKILFPDRKRASSLYQKIDLRYRADLSAPEVRKKIS